MKGTLFEKTQHLKKMYPWLDYGQILILLDRIERALKAELEKHEHTDTSSVSTES